MTVLKSKQLGSRMMWNRHRGIVRCLFHQVLIRSVRISQPFLNGKRKNSGPSNLPSWLCNRPIIGQSGGKIDLLSNLIADVILDSWSPCSICSILDLVTSVDRHSLVCYPLFLWLTKTNCKRLILSFGGPIMALNIIHLSPTYATKPITLDFMYNPRWFYDDSLTAWHFTFDIVEPFKLSSDPFNWHLTAKFNLCLICF